LHLGLEQLGSRHALFSDSQGDFIAAVGLVVSFLQKARLERFELFPGIDQITPSCW
jgi:hypothetical protein